MANANPTYLNKEIALDFRALNNLEDGTVSSRTCLEPYLYQSRSLLPQRIECASLV
jgi:hypothetical protein